MSKLIDMTGQTFTRWTIIERAENDKHGKVQWLCRCDCGTERVVDGAHLRGGRSRSCGCLRLATDLTGEKLGRWTVIERAENDKRGRSRWLCHCTCGTKKMVPGNRLRNGSSQSCGCLARDLSRARVSLPDGQAAANVLLASYKRRATVRNYSFDLTDEEFFALTKQNCHYCGVEPNAVKFNSTRNSPYIYNGVDRVDSSQGYTTDNTVPCCTTCNHAKNALSVEEFMEWLRQASRFQFKREWDKIEHLSHTQQIQQEKILHEQ